VRSGAAAAVTIPNAGRSTNQHADEDRGGATAFERPGRDLDGGPLPAPAAGLMGDKGDR